MQIECFKRANRFIMKIQIRSTRLEWCFSVTGMFNTGLTVARDQMSDEDKTERNVGSFCSLRETVELCCLYLAATSFSAGWPVAVSAVLEAFFFFFFCAFRLAELWIRDFSSGS